MGQNVLLFVSCLMNKQYTLCHQNTELIQLELKYFDIKQMLQIIIKAVVVLLLFLDIKGCFIVHFVYYGTLPDYDYERISRFSYPYILHLNEEIELPNEIKFNRTLTAVEKSDVKKMQVIYRHGGLYLDNDHFVKIDCIKKILCNLRDGMYVLDWVDGVSNYWQSSVPISFIFSMYPNNSTILKILTNYDQSINQTIYFSGPFHAQKFRQEISFIKVSNHCEFHLGMQSWNKQKNTQYRWVMNTQNKLSKNHKSDSKIELQTFRKQILQRLWQSHTVIYPINYNLSQLQNFNPQFNHVQMIDNYLIEFKVIRYSKQLKIKQNLIQIQRFYNKTSGKYSREKLNDTSQNQNNTHTQTENRKINQQTKKWTPFQFKQNFPQIFLELLIFGCLIVIISKIIRACINNPENNHQIGAQQSDKIHQSQVEIETTQQNQTQFLNNFLSQVSRFMEKQLIKIGFVIVCLIILFNFRRLSSQLGDKFINQTIPQNKQISQFGMKWTPNQNKFFYPFIGLKQLGILKDIHIDSAYDFMNTVQTKKFKRFQKKFIQNLNFGLKQFQISGQSGQTNYLDKKQIKIQYEQEKKLECFYISEKVPQICTDYVVITQMGASFSILSMLYFLLKQQCYKSFIVSESLLNTKQLAKQSCVPFYTSGFPPHLFKLANTVYIQVGFVTSLQIICSFGVSNLSLNQNERIEQLKLLKNQSLNLLNPSC